MPNTREKLIEILGGYNIAPPCDTCKTPIGHCHRCGMDRLSDYLIAADFHKRRLLDGITLSGGDPFCQQEACMELLDLLPGVNVWIYTGYEYEDICDTPLAKRADVLVTGRFVQDLRCEGTMYGSSNQRIIRRTHDARQKRSESCR